MKKTDNALNILTAMTYKGIGKAWVANNLKNKQPIESIVGLLNIKGIDVTLYSFNEKKDEIRDMLNSLYIQSEGFEVSAIGDDDFPEFRGNIKASEQPVVLFYKGNLDLLQKDNYNTAVIGLLNPTEDIIERERITVKSLVKQGVTIVSGLALGCDSVAHYETLENNGNTIAILPSPLNNVLPKSNLPLAREILHNNGLLITEYHTNISSRYELSARYIERDRLQALYSDCVILSASYAENNEGNDSGSRHAMAKAKEYGIKRVVIYDEKKDINNPMFDLSRKLIRKDFDIRIINTDNDVDDLLKVIYNSSKEQQMRLF
ncbi:MAG: DNA-processing protein DprA [Bacteroidales bacterium]|nr:DNA-processing protein DprA [Bacteroidales bacterium]